jgi:hypothetical protein
LGKVCLICFGKKMYVLLNLDMHTKKRLWLQNVYSQFMPKIENTEIGSREYGNTHTNKITWIFERKKIGTLIIYLF